MKFKDSVPARPHLPSVIEWMGFRSADAKYRALVSVSEQIGDAFAEQIPERVSTASLSKIEAEIFGIEACEVPALFWAYERYLNLIGFRDVPFGEFAREEQNEFRSFIRGEEEWSFDNAVEFMEVCGLDRATCLGWVCKNVAAASRTAKMSAPRPIIATPRVHEGSEEEHGNRGQDSRLL